MLWSMQYVKVKIVDIKHYNCFKLSWSMTKEVMNNPNYCTQIVNFILMFSCKIEAAYRYEHLEKHYESLEKERNRVNYFQYIKVSTEVPIEWSAFPQKRKNINVDQFMDKKYKCPVQMDLNLLNYKTPNVTVCLFKDEVESSLYLPDAKVHIEGKASSASDFYKDLQPVTGYVVREVDSVVSGYIINKQFYGTIRLFDTRSSYHIVYYLEPIPNLILYNTIEEPFYPTTSTRPQNAILFEYISHEDQVHTAPHPIGKREIRNDKARSSDTFGGDINTLEDHNSSSDGIPAKNSDDKILDKYSKPPKEIVSQGLKYKVKKNSTGNVNEYYRGLFRTYFRKINRTSQDILPDLFGKNIRKRAPLPNQADVDTKYFNVDNILSEGPDVIETIPFSRTTNSENVFDMRRDHPYQCSLCIFIQPNFADKFGYGGGLKFGTGEILRVVSLLNWVFKTIDFNGDGLPEKIGFIVKEVRVTDSVVIKPYTLTPAGPGSKGFIEDIETISEDHVLNHYLAQLQTLFKESCCGTLGFVYHNMAPSISTTNLRGLCTKKNVAIISGYVHAHKISLYDVYRGMFHAIGHLFGAPHDNLFDVNCWDTTFQSFLNPFTMHPSPQLNVGFRPNSMTYTLCSKLQISRFLASDEAHCLVVNKSPFCGDGMKDDKEECDCGNPWQCYSNLPEGGLCCGLRNSVLECKNIRLTDSCPRSFLWTREFSEEK